MVYPAALECCDGRDNDCDYIIPDEEFDLDSDGFVACSIDSLGWFGSSFSVYGDDCDNFDSSVYLGSAYAESNFLGCMIDVDYDGYGDSNPPAGVVAGIDCDDKMIW